MRRRDWWIGVGILAVATLLHGLVPRYSVEIRNDGLFRFDRWTGRMEAGTARNLDWVTIAAPRPPVAALNSVAPAPAPTDRTVWEDADRLLATPPPQRLPLSAIESIEATHPAK